MVYRWIAQSAQPPHADPHVRCCDSDSGQPPAYVNPRDWMAAIGKIQLPRDLLIPWL
jgi:hypothetical protein